VKGRELAYVGVLVLAIALYLVVGNAYVKHVLVMCVIFAIYALSFDIIMGGMGQFSFGHAAFFGGGAYASAIVCQKLGWSVWLGFIAAIVYGVVSGFFIGYICLRRTRGVTLAVITLGFQAIIAEIARSWHAVTGGMSGIVGIPHPSFFGIKIDPEFKYYFLALAFLLAMIYFVSRLWRSKLGRAVMGVHQNEPLAMSIGVSPFFYYTLAFTIACALASLSGALWGHYQGIVTPIALSPYYSFMVVAMVLVGGAGTIGGPILGAVIFIWVPELLRVAENLRFAMLGAILVTCVIAMPRGIYPSLESLFTRLIDRVKRQQLRGK